jgi:hypothetical protein
MFSNRKGKHIFGAYIQMAATIKKAIFVTWKYNHGK